MQIEEVSSSKAVSMTDRIYERILRLPPGWYNEFLVDVQKARCLILRNRRNGDGGSEPPIGYAFIRRGGSLGPLLVTSREFFRPALRSALMEVVRLDGSDEVTIFYAGTNTEAARESATFGLRITYPLLFLSSKGMGEWRNYLFHSPALM